MDSESTNNLVEPVYFKNSDVPIERNRWLTTFEICTACELVINPEITPDNKVRYTEAAQKIGDLWRIYLNDENARVNLLLQGITLRGMHIELKDKNPFLKPGFEGYKTTRLFIRNIPLSFANAEIDKYLKNKGVEMANDIKYARARDPNGKLTNFKTGDRFVDIIIPDIPLPKKLEMGAFTASLYHKEQKLAIENKECGNCMQKGHVRKDCPNEAVCYDCRQPGHKKGDPTCPLTDDYLSTTSEIKETEETDSEQEGEIEGEVEDDSEHESEKDNNKTVSQMIHEAMPGTPKSKTQKGDKQILMTSYIAPSLLNAKPNSRASSPAGVRKLADRSPDVDPATSHKDNKKLRRNAKTSNK